MAHPTHEPYAGKAEALRQARRKGVDPVSLWHNLSMPPPDEERRQHGRREDRAEMFLGASRTTISNLSVNGAFVSILSGLHPEDTFSFELALENEEGAAVRGKALVVWVDPGIGAGVRFDLSVEDRARLTKYLEQLGGEHSAIAPEPGSEEPGHEPPRQSRRSVALGSNKPGESTKVRFRYLLPEGAGKGEQPEEPEEPE